VAEGGNARQLKQAVGTFAQSLVTSPSGSDQEATGDARLRHDSHGVARVVSRLVLSPWVPVMAVTGWFAWAYLHLRPAASVSSSLHPMAAYGPWAWTHLGYSDIISLYYAFHLANHALPYLHSRVEYPVLTGLFMWLAAWAPGVQGYFWTSSLGLLGCALGTTYCLYRLDRRFAWAFALCPLLLVYGLLNWDLLAIFFMVAGWARFRARSYAAAGVFLSLGVWAEFFPILLFFYCVVSLLGDPLERVHARRMVSWGGAVALLVNVPFAVADLGNWDHFFVFNARRGGRGGILFALHLASALPVSAVDLFSGVLVVLAVALLVPRVLRGGSPAGAAAIGFAVLLVVNKVYSPQYMLWLFVFGIIAEWPAWSLVLMSVTGFVDYGDAMMALHLSHNPSPASSWFFHAVYPWNKALRYGSIVLVLVTSQVTARHHRRRCDPATPSAAPCNDDERLPNRSTFSNPRGTQVHTDRSGPVVAADGQ
jgi:hypothetical protein